MIDSNVLAANRAYLLGWNDGPAVSDIYRSGIPHATLNGVVRVTGRPLAEAYEEARDRLDGVPRVWWVGEDSEPGTAEGLLELGARPLGDGLPVMVTEVASASVVPDPSGLEIQYAADVDEFVAAYARVSGIPERGVPLTVERDKAFGGSVMRLVGRLSSGQIAGTVEAWFSHGIVTLYFVGTQPEFRRRGIGASMTQAVLRHAAVRGVGMAALTSSDMAVPVYRRLGFREVGRYRLFTF
ncbi:GNAT family N-acetyltransferase [Actinoplanes solisilvae]|uniref:GNAT family N-acetyltransferase n=1 Tax=Actinoplanes solisilvae TaxID=2486853 RepID=UPI000FD707FF|nr:GNAT family N-acetyltransferase [Actinoplanes solisilvae]